MEIRNLMSFPAVVLFYLGCSCAILSSFFLWQQIGEINRKLPDNEQVSYWGMHPVKMARIRREYKSLYPSGRIDLIRRLLEYAATAFFVLLLIPLGFFK
jgi:hypothetical protein